MPLTLTTLGSRGVEVQVYPAPLPEAGPGGVAIELSLPAGPLVLCLTREECTSLLQLLELGGETVPQDRTGDRVLAVTSDPCDGL